MNQAILLVASLLPVSALAAELAALKLNATIPLRATLHHVQGIDTDGKHLWVSSVWKDQKKGFLSKFELASGKLLVQVEVQDGARIHPGGIALHRDSIWIPVAEYDRDGPTSVQRRDSRTLALQSSFDVNDHIGCIAAAKKFLIGGNWDSRTLYRWSHAGRELARTPNPRANAYQDLKFVSGELVGSGLGPSKKDGAIEWLDAARGFRLTRRIEAGATDRGVAFTNEGMAIHGGKLYLLPEDDPSRLFVFTLGFNNN